MGLRQVGLRRGKGHAPCSEENTFTSTFSSCTNLYRPITTCSRVQPIAINPITTCAERAVGALVAGSEKGMCGLPCAWWYTKATM